MGFAPLGLLLLVAAGLATPPTCRVSEFFCDTGQCVALDRFCDGEDDCGDKSDEPRYCSREYRTCTGRHLLLRATDDLLCTAGLDYFLCAVSYVSRIYLP
jgi:hypothetical protein